MVWDWLKNWYRYGNKKPSRYSYDGLVGKGEEKKVENKILKVEGEECVYIKMDC